MDGHALVRGFAVITDTIQGSGVTASRRARVVVSLAITLLAGQSAALAQESGGSAAAAADARWMRCAGNDVNVRSHPDMNSVAVTQLAKGQRVREVGRDGPWSKIEPPAGTFCFVSAKHVTETAQGKHIVGDLGGAEYTLRVRAGSTLDDVAPEVSEKVGAVKQGQPLDVMGTQGEWLKIAPPAGVYFYVSSEFLEPDASPAGAPTTAPEAGAADVERPADPTADHTPANDERPGSAFDEVAAKENAREIPTGPWATRLRAVEARITQEAPKPSAEQDWSAIVAELRPIAAQREDRDTASYASGWIQRIEERVTKLEAMKNQNAAVSAPSLHSPRNGALSGAGTAPPAPTDVAAPSSAPAVETRGEPPVASEAATPPTPASQPAIVAPAPPPALVTDSAASATGMLLASFAVPPGPYGLRFRLVDRYSREVRGYVEFPLGRGFDPVGAVGQYVRVSGVKYRDVDAGVEIIRAETMATISLGKE